MIEQVKDLVTNRLQKRLRIDLQTAVNRCVEQTLEDVRLNLIIKLVPVDAQSFSVDFTWKSTESDKGGST